MKSPSLPFEDKGNIFGRWWRNSTYPFRSFKTIWDDIYLGDSLVAPIQFAYIWVLVFIPVIFVAVKMGLSPSHSQTGNNSGMDPTTPVFVGGEIIIFIFQPFITMYLGGSVAHGVLCTLDSSPRGFYRKTLRATGYANAWLVPLAGILITIRLFCLFNPFSAIRSDLTLSPFSIVLMIADLALSVGSASLVIWGLKSVYRLGLWKSILSWFIAWICMLIALNQIALLGIEPFWRLVMSFGSGR